MKTDDPKLTAFALGELAPAERPTIERELRAHRELAAEVEETQQMARILRDGLRGEVAGDLAEHQRDAIFRAARIAQTHTSPVLQSAVPLTLPKPAWWNRPGPWQAVAACTMLGFGIYVLSTDVNQAEFREAVAKGSELMVPVPMDPEVAKSLAHVPEMLTPKEEPPAPSLAGNNLEAAKNRQSVPNIQPLIPSVKITPPDARGKAMQAKVSDASTIAHAQREVERGPRVVSAKNPELANNLAGADIGKAPRKAEITEEMALMVTKALIEEASGVQEGATYAEFSQVFRPVAGAAGTFEMIRCPSIRVDAEVVTADGQSLPAGATPESRIKKVSNLYLVTE